MTAPAPRFSVYDCEGRSEFLVGFGPVEADRRLLVVPPLFEELNRTRKLISDLMRTLAGRGIACYLPDLPGTGESMTPLEETSWESWRKAAGIAGGTIRATHVIAMRGGCLLDDALEGLPHYRIAPIAGKNLLRDLVRARALGDDSFDKEAQAKIYDGDPTLLGGYPVSASMARSLRDAEPASMPHVQTARLESDLAEAQDRLPGAAPWRRAEPSGWPEMTASLVEIIDVWSK